MLITSAQFVTSAATLQQCPPSLFPEFAFFGRSNVGKSSLINMLTQRHNLAKASSSPGKTRLFNFFLINEARYLVDLPGYGYAKASDSEKTTWLDMTQEFLMKREALKKVFLLIDASIPPQRIDIEMIQSFVEEQIDFSIVFTKHDKGTQKDRSTYLKLFKQELQKLTSTPPPLFFVSNIS
ncbi:MAG: ribosome biogenesis GTP-binding protein YihA/YsxC [Candidatus Peribacteria bacterium]|jgi:GTP-binding protein|nr:ribosome biogenesis GTP-binding protein YihA/YsxC [Candidatus Peribacteria bacterium]